MNDTVVLGGDADLVTQIDGDLGLDNLLDGEIGVITALRDSLPEYTGATTVTPTNQSQVLNTAQKSVLDNITVNAIPDTYGEVAFDGSTLTIS